jgi:cell division protein FtsB
MRRRVVVPLLGTMVAVIGLLVGVFPTRALLDQRAAMAETEHRLSFVEERNEELADRVEALGTDEEVERIAREQYNLVFPGEEAYGILPATPPPPVVPDAWPFRDLAQALAAEAAAP